MDPDAGRRSSFVRRVAPLLAPLDGLTTGSCAAPPFEGVWAAGAQAPVDAMSGDAAAVVFGTAIDPDGSLVGAAALHERWHRQATGTPEPFDGYHAALAWDPAGGLRAGADALGRFPFYWWTSGDVLLIGSSAACFRHHPAFAASFDPHGLVGVLLTNGLVDGRTYWSGVHRLGPGRLLTAPPGRPPGEVVQYTLPVSDHLHGRPFSDLLDITRAALDNAVRRHVPRVPRPVLLLSGGLDSRTIAGFLARQGNPPLALTRGIPTDLELQCAVKVARRLGFEHRVTETEFERAADDAVTRAVWEHGAPGFSNTGGWSSARTLHTLAARAITGDAMDWVLGGPATEDTMPTFEALLLFHNRWGIAPDALARLLRPEVFGDAVRETIAALRGVFEDYPDPGFSRSWCFALHHRHRFHISGLSWPLSFGAWPLVPSADLKLLEVAAGLPLQAVEHRRLQTELLRRVFPALARLPLDRNSFNTMPLTPGLGWRVRRRLRREFHRFVPPRPPAVERRRYYRVMDVNGPAWRAIRTAAEPHRRLAYAYFRPQELDAIVPPPDAQPAYADPITGPAAMKSLIGFMLWLSRQ